MKSVKDKALLYKSKLGLNLSPIFFEDSKSNLIEQNQIDKRSSFNKTIVSSKSSGYSKLGQSFGEEKLKASVLVKYKVINN